MVKTWLTRQRLTLGAFRFRKLSVDFRHFRVFVFCHRAYSKIRKPRKILISSFFEALRLYLSSFEHSYRCFEHSGHNPKSDAQSHQGVLSIEA